MVAFNMKKVFLLGCTLISTANILLSQRSAPELKSQSSTAEILSSKPGSATRINGPIVLRIRPEHSNQRGIVIGQLTLLINPNI
jgi:hypothetical protein